MKTHFKRQGSAGLLILQGVTKNYHIEYDHKYGYLKAERHWEEPKKRKGKVYYESHHETILYKNYNKTLDGKENFQDIEIELNKVLPYAISIELFIESYYIEAKEGDRDILNGINVTSKTVAEVINECKIKLTEFFKPWHVDSVSKHLENPNEKVNKMKFSDLYSLIHWNHYKQNFVEVFVSSIK